MAIEYDPTGGGDVETPWPPRPLRLEEIEALLHEESWERAEWIALRAIRQVRLYLLALEPSNLGPIAINEIESDLDWTLWGAEAKDIANNPIHPMYDLFRDLQAVWPRAPLSRRRSHVGGSDPRPVPHSR